MSWLSSFGHTDRITLVQKLNQWVGFLNFNIEMKWVFLAKSIDGCARGRGFVPGFSIAGNWSRYNLYDIVTKASVAFVATTDPDVHFKCCISADTKIQASIKRETELKPIHRKSWFHSSLPFSFRYTRWTQLLAINRQVFVVVVFHIALKFLVVVQDAVVIKNGKWKLTTFIFS